MKILKVRIARSAKAGGGTEYTYPPEYDSKKISVMAYETSSDDGDSDLHARNDGHEFCIGVVKDADAPQFLASADIEEITKSDAETLGDRYSPQVIMTQDQNKVNLIYAKFVNSQAISAQELKALDPDDAEPGINKSAHFSTRLGKMLGA